jgi:putative transport protein
MIDRLFEMLGASPVAQEMGLIVLVCALGMALGSLKYKGIGLGSAGVLFLGVVVSHFCDPVDRHTLTFVREFGLVLFVFAMGLQLGPGFVASLRQEGLQLNILAAILVILAGLLAPLVIWLFGMQPEAAAGLFAGATTNTPALGAAQQALAELPDRTPEQLAIPALACAVSYPMGVAGLLGVLLAIKIIFRIDPRAEAQRYFAEKAAQVEPVLRQCLSVTNRELDGVRIAEACARVGTGVHVSRLRRGGEAEVQVALPVMLLHVGDVILAVGSSQLLSRFQQLVGERSTEDLMLAPGKVNFRRLAVTQNEALGKTIAELRLQEDLGVNVSRLTRGDIEMTASPGLRLKFGDVLQVVGPDEQLEKAAGRVGNSLKTLNETQFIPLFAGIFIGILVGSIPLAVPGLSQPLRLGLAGGPLIIALVLGRIGRIGGLIWHMPHNANHAFREFGISLFFAALGLAAGKQFFETAFSPEGLLWLGTGTVITLVPPFVVGMYARHVAKLNFITLGGMLSGATTNPPGLAFVNNLCGSDAAGVAYATVYPLTTLLRILVAQLLIVLFCR